MLVVVGIAIAVLLAGCDTAQESAYKDKISAMMSKWNAISSQLDDASEKCIAQVQAAAKNGDPNAALAQIQAALDTFLMTFNQAVDQIAAMQTELNQLQVPPKYMTEHKMMLNGMSTVANSLENQRQATGLLRNLQPGQMDAAMVQIETAETYLQQGIDNLNLAAGYLFPKNWPLTIAIWLAFLGIAVGLGFWSGKMAQRQGRSFNAFFCLGFFFGLIGVGIAWLVLRGSGREQKTERAVSQMPAFQVQPVAGSAFLSDMIRDGDTLDSAPPAQAPVPPPVNYPGYMVQPPTASPSASYQANAPAPPQPTPMAAPFGHCPACGIALPQPGAFCLRCGAPIPQVGS